MKALIHNAQVVQVAPESFPVHPSMQWLDCPAEVQPGWTYDDGVFTAPVIEPEPAPVITSVGPLQLAQALEDIGMFNTVNTWANAQGGMTAYAWNRATSFERTHPMVLAAQEEMELTDEEIDNLFALAATK